MQSCFFTFSIPPSRPPPRPRSLHDKTSGIFLFEICCGISVCIFQTAKLASKKNRSFRNANIKIKTFFFFHNFILLHSVGLCSITMIVFSFLCFASLEFISCNFMKAASCHSNSYADETAFTQQIIYATKY